MVRRRMQGCGTGTWCSPPEETLTGCAALTRGACDERRTTIWFTNKATNAKAQMEQPQPFRKENGIMKANLKNIIGLAALGKALHTPTPQPAPKARKEYGMKNYNALKNQITSRMLSIACAIALAVAFAVLLPQSAHADQIPAPSVPPEIQVPAGNVPFLEGHVLEDHSVHTQNYICLPCPNPSISAKACPNTSRFAWLLFTLEATLFNDDGSKQLTIHFFSSNPDEGGKIRATWQHSQDTSTV